MIPEYNTNTIQHLFDLINTGNIPEAISLFSEDVEFISPVTRAKHSGIAWDRPRYGGYRKSVYRLNSSYYRLFPAYLQILTSDCRQ